MKNPAKNPVKKLAKIVPPIGTRPGRNGGTLNTGGNGSVNGGRPPSELRALAREAVSKALPNIERLAINADLSARDGDSVAAFNALTKLGVPQQHEVGENQESPLLTPAQREARLKQILGG